jgi:RND family efflux transporter MFP subunit
MTDNTPDNTPAKQFSTSLRKTIIRILLPVVIVALGACCAYLVFKSGPEAKRRQPVRQATWVQVLTAQRTSPQVNIQAMGTVMPARQVALHSQVSGRVMELAPEFVIGGHFQAEEMMLKTDPREYQLTIVQRQSDVTRARYELKLEIGRQDIAKREMELFQSGKSASKTDRALALRKPHLANARASLKAAKAALAKARLDLERTEIKAPFNALIQEKLIDLGANISPQTLLATLVGTDQYYVEASIPANHLQQIKIPSDSQTIGARVTIKPDAKAKSAYPGRVIRLRADLEREGRMARILIAIQDPLGLQIPVPPDKSPLLLGAFVNLEIEGPHLKELFAIPVTALRDGKRLWIMDTDNILEIRDTEIVWRERETVYVKNGLHEGENLIVSAIAAPVAGMPLRLKKIKGTNGNVSK